MKTATPEQYWKAMTIPECEEMAEHLRLPLESIEHVAYQFLPRAVKEEIRRRMGDAR